MRVNVCFFLYPIVFDRIFMKSTSSNDWFELLFCCQSTALVLSILVDNFDKKSKDQQDIIGLKKAMAWEKRFVAQQLYTLCYLSSYLSLFTYLCFGISS